MSTKRRALGRGLDSLIKPAAASEVRTLRVSELKPNRFQPRRDFEPAALQELADSIRAQGLVQPIVVAPDTDGGFTIVAGERRWRAAQLAGLEQVPVAMREVRDDRHRLELALVENLQRSDLNSVEEALAFQALQQDFGLSQEEIATRVGKSRPAVSNSLRLLNLPQSVLTLMRTGKLTAGQARPLLGLGKPAAQQALAERAVKERLSAREIEALVARQTGKAPDRPARRRGAPQDVHTAAAADRLTRRLQTKVEIRRRKTGGGTLQIHFFSEEDLMRLYDRLVAGGEEE